MKSIVLDLSRHHRHKLAGLLCVVAWKLTKKSPVFAGWDDADQGLGSQSRSWS